MAFDYQSIIDDASELIEEFGREVAFVELGDVAANPAQPWLGASGLRSSPKQTLLLNAVFVEPESMERLGNDAVTEDFIKKSQQIAIVYSPVELKVFDEVIDIDGSRWRIIDLSKLKPGPLLVLYFVSLKR